jgi:hypothetical protein
MKKYLCDICGSSFKSQESVEQHKKRNPLIESDYHDFILKNKNKYFIFYDSNKISRKHDKLYGAFTLNKKCFLNKIYGNVVKKSRNKFPSKIIENNFSNLREEESFELSKYLNNLGSPKFNN